MGRWKRRAEQGRGREKRKIRRKKMQMREKVGKSRNTVFSQWFWGSGGSKSRLAKAAGAEAAVVARSTFGSQNVTKTPGVRTTFGSCDVEKVHAVVARSTFWSQNVQNTPASDHFWKLRCRKSARRCGANHISKSKCTKHTRSGPLLAVEMSEKWTPLWRKAHFQVKMYKTHTCSRHFWRFGCRKSARRCGAKHISKSKCNKTPHVRATFGGSDVEKVHAVVARRTFRSKNVQNTRDSDHFWRFRCRFASIHYTTGHYTTLQYTTLHYTTLQYTPLH